MTLNVGCAHFVRMGNRYLVSVVTPTKLSVLCARTARSENMCQFLVARPIKPSVYRVLAVLMANRFLLASLSTRLSAPPVMIALMENLCPESVGSCITHNAHPVVIV